MILQMITIINTIKDWTTINQISDFFVVILWEIAIYEAES